jgi:hypothetical protein
MSTKYKIPDHIRRSLIKLRCNIQPSNCTMSKRYTHWPTNLCPLCNDYIDDNSHILQECTCLEDARFSIIDKTINILKNHFKPNSSDSIDLWYTNYHINTINWKVSKQSIFSLKERLRYSLSFTDNKLLLYLEEHFYNHIKLLKKINNLLIFHSHFLWITFCERGHA